MTGTRNWLITGASRGLGRALVEAALAAGDAVVATVRSGSGSGGRSGGGARSGDAGRPPLPDHERLEVVELDVRDRTAAHRAVAAAEARFGGLDVLVNSAGFGLIGAIEEASEAEAREILDTNLLGPLWFSQAAVPALRRRGGGTIVQISSVGGVGAMPTLGLYNAGKWGLEGFSEALAAEVRGFGIDVVIVEPGELDTDWARGSMRFAAPLPEYDELRRSLFGTAEVPWPEREERSGTAPADAARAILARVDAARAADAPHAADGPDPSGLRLLVGDDAPGQVRAALDLRCADYARDPRFAADG